MLDHVLGDTVRPCKFQQVHGVHLPDLFKAYGIRTNLFAVHPEQGTGFDIVETPILNEELDSRPSIRTLLDLIKEDQRLAGNQRHTEESGNAHDNGIHVSAILEDVGSAWSFDEVDLDEMLVLLPSELANERGFADLPSSSDEQGLPLRIFLPFQ